MSDTNVNRAIIESIYDLIDLLPANDKASVSKKLSTEDTSRYDIHTISRAALWIIANPPSHNDTTFEKYYSRYNDNGYAGVLPYIPRNIFHQIIISLDYKQAFPLDS